MLGVRVFFVMIVANFEVSIFVFLMTIIPRARVGYETADSQRDT